MAESSIDAGLEAYLTARVERGVKELSLRQRNLDYSTGRRVEAKSTTTQTGASEITGHRAGGITYGFHGSLAPSKADEGVMSNLNGGTIITQSPMFGNSQVQPVNFHSFAPFSTNIPPCGASVLNNSENKRVSHSDSEMGCNLNLSSAPLRPVRASNSQQPEKQDSFSRRKPIRRVRDKPKLKKMCAARKSDFSTCINKFKELPEFTESDIGHVVEIFSDEYYRKAFIAMDRDCKVFFLRNKIDEAKEK